MHAPPLFEDRRDPGRQLARLLGRYRSASEEADARRRSREVSPSALLAGALRQRGAQGREAVV